MAPVGALFAQETDAAAAKPDSLNVGRIDRITQFFGDEVASHRLSGAVVMISRGGNIAYQEAFGVRDPDTRAGMLRDSIFRIYSMTKPVTAVAVLMLVEDGKIHLGDAASAYLPAMKSPRVLIEQTDGVGGRFATTVPADHEITIEELLTHTSGITYGAGSSLAEQMMKDAGIGLELGAAGIALASRINDGQMVEKIARVPLMFQPGTAWHYGRSFDVLLALIEAVSGVTADQFYEQRIFRPLGMTDTFFNLPPDRRNRVAQPGPNPYSFFGRVPLLTNVSLPRTFLAGGAGLLSTAPDYMRFASMLANEGELDGVRILMPETVALMTSDRIGPALARPPAFNPAEGYGFGLGVPVRTRSTASIPGEVGEFNGYGAAGTLFWVDPAEHLVAVLMTQSPDWAERKRAVFRTLVYQSLPNNRSRSSSAAH
jgi:CubicO group peptidase (beta-lactamase class C family)